MKYIVRFCHKKVCNVFSCIVIAENPMEAEMMAVQASIAEPQDRVGEYNIVVGEVERETEAGS